MTVVHLKRVYEEPSATDGRRVLVDRLWPRGLSKDRAALDEWLRDVAPSANLRRWYAHRLERHAEFEARYVAELAAHPAAEAVARLEALAAEGPITLLTAVRELELSHARVLAGLLGGRPPGFERSEIGQHRVEGPEQLAQ